MSDKHQHIVAEWEAHCNRLKTPATVGDSTPENKRARFNLLQKDFASWFDYYFPSFKSNAGSHHMTYANKYLQKTISG